MPQLWLRLWTKPKSGDTRVASRLALVRPEGVIHPVREKVWKRVGLAKRVWEAKEEARQGAQEQPAARGAEVRGVVAAKGEEAAKVGEEDEQVITGQNYTIGPSGVTRPTREDPLPCM